MNGVRDLIRRALGGLPGRIETVGMVKRRMLVVAVVGPLAATGALTVMRAGPADAPFSDQELRDLSGLPEPPVRFAQEQDGTLRELTPEEQQQLRELQELIRNFPAPDSNFPGSRLTPSPEPSAAEGAADETGGG